MTANDDDQHMEKFSGIVGTPELESKPGMSFTLTHKLIQIDDPGGFRSLDLAQLDGTILALDWVVGETHHIWGSAVIVAPGVALTASHVIAEMRASGFLGEKGGYLLALGFQANSLVIWNPDSFTSVGNGDLSILTLVNVTHSLMNNGSKNFSLSAATFAARQPASGERISLLGFAASDIKFNDLTQDRPAGVSLLGSVGIVIDIYEQGRDRTLPNPSVAVAAKTIGGMSGGGAFDEHGRLIGIISSGLDEVTSFISLSWPCLFTPLQVTWPPGLILEPLTLHAMTQQGLSKIDNIQDVHSHVDENGSPLVSLTHDL